MRVKPTIVKDISKLIRGNGLDPKPVREPVAIRSGDKRLITETYTWGEYHVATWEKMDQSKPERWAWIGGASFQKVPLWARQLVLKAGIQSARAIKSAELRKLGPTERASRRLSNRFEPYEQPQPERPESVALALRCVELICARCSRRLSKSQGSSRDGELFIRDHYGSSKYLSVFVRQGEKVIKKAQIWPLSRRNAFHVQLQGLTKEVLKELIPPQYEVVTWKDRKPRVVVKNVDEVGISYVARAVAHGLEVEDAL
jgi:hypothetical protein